jgi:predicted esterase
MKTFRIIPLLAVAAIVPAFLFAQNYAPPAGQAPDEATLKTIQERIDKLGSQLNFLRKNSVHDPELADVEVYHKAAVWIVRHNEFYSREAANWTLKVLELGLLRASQLAQGEKPWYSRTGQDNVRAYRSRIDGSVQPYAVSLPGDYGKNPRQQWRLDVVLHGRDASLTEVKFIYNHDGAHVTPKSQDFVQLDIYGRGNNAYRWAGEVDVFEALESFLTTERLLGRGALIDLNRTVLRGFSMGGAGTWHIGLHYPSRWCVLGPGAGFTTTHGYIRGLPEKLPAYQEKCLRIYDAVDYAENAFDVPVVAYAGANDPQLQAAKNIEERLKALEIKMQLLIAPGLKHQFPPEWQKKAQAAYAEYAGPGHGREEYPKRVLFTTYTLKYPGASWVEILGLGRHYDKALVDASKTDSGYTVKTQNVRTLRLALPDDAGTEPLTVKIDGQEISTRPYQNSAGQLNLYLERRGDVWKTELPLKIIRDRLRRPQKTEGIHGPIDDAFMTSFLCVRGTGKTWHSATSAYAAAALRRFQHEWNKYLRGDLPVKNDVDVTEEDIINKNLILFGDASSNALIGQLLDRLPLEWTKDTITFAGKTYRSDEHIPVLIYPSPLSATRYVVLNTGHTFHAADFQGTNALLYPRLGDYAILKLTPTEADPAAADVAMAGIFDDFWQVEKD